jgi:endosialidase-like protein
MRNLQQKLLSTVALSMVFAFRSSVAAFGAEPQRPGSTLAHLNVGPSRIDWLPAVDYERLVLTVVGPGGFFLRQENEADHAPSMEVFDSQGNRLPDGIYAWELRASPRIDRATREAVTRARDVGERSVIETLEKLGKLPDRPLLQSGNFFVKSGSFVPVLQPQIPVGPPPMQSLTSQDSIEIGNSTVKGNACIGSGCATNGSNTDFSVLRLKATDVNILFDDQGVVDEGGGASESIRRWELVVNPSGEDRISIKDIDNNSTPFKLAGGAAENSLVVASNGNLGLSTSTPAQRLHLISGNSPAVRLEQDGSNGLAPRSWDLAGNDVGFFLKDVANSSAVPFRIRAGAPTSSIEVLADGKVGIGTASPVDKIDIQGSAAGAATGRIGNSNAAGFSGWEYADQTGTVNLFIGRDNGNGVTRFNSINNNPIVFLLNSTERLRFPTTGNVITAANGAFLSSGGTWTNASSRSYKKDVVDLDANEALAAVKQLDPVKFRYQAEPGQQHVGFIAEDVPELVAMNDRRSLSSMDIVAVLTKVVQEQQKMIEQLSAQLAELKHEKK